MNREGLSYLIKGGGKSSNLPSRTLNRTSEIRFFHGDRNRIQRSRPSLPEPRPYKGCITKVELSDA